MKRAAILLAALLLSLGTPVSSAFAQSNPFGPLPPAAPEETPVPTPVGGNTDDDDVGRNTLVIILGAVVALFVGIGYFITRDARRSLPEGHRPQEDPRLREEGPHRRPKEAKAKAREKTKRQKQARKANRPTRR